MATLQTIRAKVHNATASNKGQADIDTYSILHEIIDDVRDSYRVALSNMGAVDVVDQVDAVVDTYVTNYYGEE